MSRWPRTTEATNHCDCSIRGIRNVTGTACHINAALIVLGHALHPLADGIVASPACYRLGTTATSFDNETSTSFLRELGDFLSNLTRQQQQLSDEAPTSSIRTWLDDSSDESSEFNDGTVDDQFAAAQPIERSAITRRILSPLDPSILYATMKTSAHIEPQDLGDAVMALIKLLQCVLHLSTSEEGTSVVSYLQLLHNTILYSGRASSVLNGERVQLHTMDSSSSVEPERRTKQLKERLLPNPFPLDLQCGRRLPRDSPAFSSRLSLQAMLYQTFSVDQVVEGYQWSTNGMDDSISSNINSNEWVTTKRLHVTSFPPIFLIHLQRFEIGGRTCDSSIHRPTTDEISGIDIPVTLDLEQYVSCPSQRELSTDEAKIEPNTLNDQQFELAGGILHVAHPSDESDEDAIDRNGHYVAVVKSGSEWILIDDELCYVVTEDQVLSWLGGATYEAIGNDCNTDGSHMDDSQNNRQALHGLNQKSEIKHGSILRGVLVVYHRRDLALIADPILQSLHENVERPSQS